jgi:hypothetical protein
MSLSKFSSASHFTGFSAGRADAHGDPSQTAPGELLEVLSPHAHVSATYSSSSVLCFK